VIDVSIRVRGGDEHRLEGRCGQEDAAVQARAVETREELAVDSLCVRERAYRPFHEVPAEHRTRRTAPGRDAQLARGIDDAAHEALPARFQLGVRLALAQVEELRDAGRHREGIAGQRTRLVDGSRRRDALHQRATPAVRTDRQAATDYLPQRRQIGLDAESRLRTAVRDAEAGHDFVEDQQGAMLARDRANALEEAGRRWDEAAVADHRLDDD